MSKLSNSLCIFALSVLISGCASTSMLPQSAKEVDFGGATEGKTGWSSYREQAVFKNVKKAQVLQAAKAGLGDAGFTLRSVNADEGVVFGEHGMTLHDWNIIAGVYVKEEGEDTLAAVLVEGSKDIGFSGDVTGNAWTGKILRGMRTYMNQEGSR
jgi:hypothetical protein